MPAGADDHHVVAGFQPLRDAKHARLRVTGIQGKAQQPEGHDTQKGKFELEFDVDGGGRLSQYRQESFFLNGKPTERDAATDPEGRLLQSSAPNLLAQMNVPQRATTGRRFCRKSGDGNATARLAIYAGTFRGRRTEPKIR